VCCKTAETCCGKPAGAAPPAGRPAFRWRMHRVREDLGALTGHPQTSGRTQKRGTRRRTVRLCQATRAMERKAATSGIRPFRLVRVAL
jgi:predicted secreted protein